MPKSPVSAFAAAAAPSPSMAPVTAPKTKPTPVKAVKPSATPAGGPVLKRANAGTSHGLQRMHHVVNS